MNDGGIDLLSAGQGHDRSLRATADGTGNMKRGRLGRAARKNKILQRFEFRFVVVDDVLERPNIRSADRRATSSQRLPHFSRVRCSELGANGEEVALGRSGSA